jgi:hypothetical protein
MSLLLFALRQLLLHVLHGWPLGTQYQQRRLQLQPLLRSLLLLLLLQQLLLVVMLQW